MVIEPRGRTILVKLIFHASPAKHSFVYMYVHTLCVTRLQCHGADAATIRHSMLLVVVLGWTCELLGGNLFPEPNEVVESPQVPVFVVPLQPRGTMIDGDPLSQGDGLAKVNEMDTAQVSAVVHK